MGEQESVSHSNRHISRSSDANWHPLLRSVILVHLSPLHHLPAPQQHLLRGPQEPVRLPHGTCRKLPRRCRNALRASDSTLHRRLSTGPERRATSTTFTSRASSAPPPLRQASLPLAGPLRGHRRLGHPRRLDPDLRVGRRLPFPRAALQLLHAESPSRADTW